MSSNERVVVQEVVRALSDRDSCVYEELMETFEHALKNLLQQGLVHFGPDYKLGGKALEFRVQTIFEQLDFRVETPRQKQEEFIVSAANCKRGIPVVVEVKSSNKATISREYLRQLDDYIYELSDEQAIRLAGLRPKKTGTVIRPFGNWIGETTHPKPHKGLLVFNGPVTLPFDDEGRLRTNWVGHNELEFARTRGFCLVRFETLLAWQSLCLSDAKKLPCFWNAIHDTFGVMEPPAP
jgi:hypothetical protein